MTFEKKRNAAKLLSLTVFVAGLLVMVGWIFDISLLKSIAPGWITMKFSTALTFVLSAVVLYFMIRADEGEIDRSYVVLWITSLLIIMLMGTFFFSALLGVQTGEEDLFIRDTGNLSMTVTPGRPSVTSMLSFVLIALAGILTTLNRDNLRSKVRSISIIVIAIGAVAVVGYIAQVPFLYYFIPNVNSAMAFYTALCFVMLGTGLLCLSD